MDQGQIIRELKKIQKKLCSKSNLVMSFTGTEKSYTGFRKLIAASRFVGSERKGDPGWYQDKLLPGKSEAFIIPSEVSYVALGGIGEYTGEDYLLGRMVSFVICGPKSALKEGPTDAGCLYSQIKAGL